MALSSIASIHPQSARRSIRLAEEPQEVFIPNASVFFGKAKWTIDPVYLGLKKSAFHHLCYDFDLSFYPERITARDLY